MPKRYPSLIKSHAFSPRAIGGISLIELILVIILIAILTVTAGSKFFSSTGFEEHSYREEAISKLRAVQLKSMQQTNGTCNEVLFTDTQMGLPDNAACSAARSFTADWQPDIRDMEINTDHNVTFNSSAIDLVSFDNLGRPLDDCGGGCVINIVGAESTLNITIESEGYIYASN